ncbi:MAG: DUF6033 family protein [Lachnospiraceae bacterium]|nr:DUF6033 family protein [Lachnospiraceae bacterium]
MVSFDARISDNPYKNAGTQKAANAKSVGSTNVADHASKAGNVKSAVNAKNSAANIGKVTTKDFSPLKADSPLIPTAKDGYGTVIGDVELSDKAKEYYNKLKAKFHNMDFILVGKAEKGRVAANAAAYGNANKQVVLIDEEKLERMATDESFRKKYEGIIEMSQSKLSEMKNSFASSGAAVKNFGMSVDENGKTSFFATLVKSSEVQDKVLEKRRAAKKADQIKAHKKDEKEKREARLEKLREKNRMQVPEEETAEVPEEPEYVELWSDSLEDLTRTVSAYAYERSEAENAPAIGGNIDFRG